MASCLQGVLESHMTFVVSTLSDQNTFLILPLLPSTSNPPHAYLIRHPLAFICNSKEKDACTSNLGPPLQNPYRKHRGRKYKGRKVA